MARIVNERLRASFRVAGDCELCGQPCARRECVHVFPAGIGGGWRLDIEENMLGACKTGAIGGCDKHNLHHKNRSECPTSFLLAAVAKRMNLTPQEVYDRIKAKQDETRGISLRANQGKPKKKTRAQLFRELGNENCRHKARVARLQKQIAETLTS